jgi:hypothetical protein
MRRDLNSRIKFEVMAKKALGEARNAVEDLSVDDRKWYLYTEAGQRKAQREWEVRHVELDSDDDSDGEFSNFSRLSHAELRSFLLGGTLPITFPGPEALHPKLDLHVSLQTVQSRGRVRQQFQTMSNCGDTITATIAGTVPLQ